MGEGIESESAGSPGSRVSKTVGGKGVGEFVNSDGQDQINNVQKEDEK